MKRIFFMTFSLFFLFSFVCCTNQPEQNIEKTDNSVNTNFSRTARAYVSIDKSAARSAISLPEKIYYKAQAYNTKTQKLTSSSSNINDLYIFDFDIEDIDNGDYFIFIITGYAEYDENTKKYSNPILTSRYTEGTTKYPKENLENHTIKPGCDVNVTVCLQLFNKITDENGTLITCDDEGNSLFGAISLPIDIENTNINKLIVKSECDAIDGKKYTLTEDNLTEIESDNVICGDYLTYFNFYYDDNDDDDDDGILLYSKIDYISVRSNQTTGWNNDEELKITSETVKNNYNQIIVDGSYSNSSEIGTWMNPMTTLKKAINLVNCINNEFILAETVKSERSFSISIDETTNDVTEIDIVLKNISPVIEDDDGGFSLTIKSKNSTKNAAVNNQNIIINADNISLTLCNLSVQNITANSPVTIKNCTINENLAINAETTLSASTVTGATTATALLTSTGNTFTGGIKTTANFTSTDDNIYKSVELYGNEKINTTFENSIIGESSKYATFTAKYSNINLSYSSKNDSYFDTTYITNSDFYAACTNSTPVNYSMGNVTFNNCGAVTFSNLTVLGEYDFYFSNCDKITFSELEDTDDGKSISKSITRKNMTLSDSNMEYSMNQLSLASGKLIVENGIINFSNTKGNILSKGTTTGDPGFNCSYISFTNTTLDFSNCTFKSSIEMIVDGGNVSFNRVVFNNNAKITIENTDSCIMEAGSFNMLGEVNEESLGEGAFLRINTNNFTLNDEQILDYFPLLNLTFTNNTEIKIKNTLIMSTDVIFENNTSTTLTNSPICSDNISISNCKIAIDKTPYILSDLDGGNNADVSLMIEQKSATLTLINTPVQGSIKLDSESTLILNGTSYLESVIHTKSDNTQTEDGGIIFMEGDSIIKMQNLPSSDEITYDSMDIFHENPKPDKKIISELNPNGTPNNKISEYIYDLFNIITPGITSYQNSDGIYLNIKDNLPNSKTALFNTKVFNTKATYEILPGKDNNTYTISNTKINDEFSLGLYTSKVTDPVWTTTYILKDENDTIIGSKSIYMVNEFTGISFYDLAMTEQLQKGQKYYLYTYFCKDQSRENISDVSTSDYKTITITD